MRALGHFKCACLLKTVFSYPRMANLSSSKENVVTRTTYQASEHT
jgi:hypothetical protein